MVKGHLYEKINEDFAKNNIEVPYNMTTITFEKPEDKTTIEKEI
jgi:small-conductance mechanosensitive channel